MPDHSTDGIGVALEGGGLLDRRRRRASILSIRSVDSTETDEDPAVAREELLKRDHLEPELRAVSSIGRMAHLSVT